MKLKSLEFYEKEVNNNSYNYNYLPVLFNNYNLLIGDAAQGKTRLFRILNWVKNQLMGQQTYIQVNFWARFIFIVNENNQETEIIYELEIKPSPQGNNVNKYNEKITKNNIEILFSLDNQNNKKLFNEKTEEYIQNFYIPDNVSVIYAFRGEEFHTIELLRNFFSRILFFIDIFNPANINMTDSLILDSSGNNIGKLIANWKEKKIYLYHSVVEDFKRCFENIEAIKMVKLPGPFDTQIPAITEKGVHKEIDLLSWSHGMARMLCLICLPKHDFIIQEKIYPPSLICIDEIENGLDFKILKFIIKYLEDYTDQTQIIMSSHSPQAAELVHPENWQIIKRKGTAIKISKPQDIENNLKKDLDFFRQKHWDFYTRHINNADSYEPE